MPMPTRNSLQHSSAFTQHPGKTQLHGQNSRSKQLYNKSYVQNATAPFKPPITQGQRDSALRSGTHCDSSEKLELVGYKLH